MFRTAIAIALAASAAHATAGIRITEWMYDGSNQGEFIEITNTGTTAIDLTGWSYDDDSRTPGVTSLGSFGILAAGESAIISESAAATFRARWNLASSVKVLGSNTNNLGRGDEINIFDSLGNLIDRLTYADNGAAGGPRTQNTSGNILLANLGSNQAPLAVLSSIGDVFGSYASVGTTSLQIANPGKYIPTPGALAIIGLAGIVAGRRRK